MKLKLNYNRKKNKKYCYTSRRLNKVGKVRKGSLVLFTIMLFSIISFVKLPVNINEESGDLLVPIDEDLYLSKDSGHIFKFVRGISDGPATIDPTNSWDSASNDVISQVAEPLFFYNLSDPDLPRLNWLAESYSWPTTTTLEINITLGVTFHDGTIMDAAACAWSFDRLIWLMNHTGEMPSNMSRAIIHSLYEFPDGSPVMNRTNVVDSDTFQIILNAPYTQLLASMAYVSCDILSPTSTPVNRFLDKSNPSDSLVGTGPFVYDFYIADTEVRFHAFNDYWQGKPKIDVMVYNIMDDSEIRNEAMLDGRIDLLSGARADLFDDFQASPDITFYESPDPGLVISYLGMNNDHYTILDGDVDNANIGLNITWREAITFAINYSYIVHEYWQDEMIRANSWISPAYGPYFDDTLWDDIAPDEGNRTHSRKVIKAAMDANNAIVAALPNGADPSVDDAAWEAVTIESFNYSYNTDNQFRTDLYPLLQDWLGKIGINVIDGGTTFNYFIYRAIGYVPGGYDQLQLYWVGWGPDYLDPMNMIQPLVSNISASNSAQVNDPQIEAWISDYNTNTLLSDSERKWIIWNITHRCSAELFTHVFGYHSKVFSVHSKSIDNVPYNSVGSFWAYPITLNPNFTQSMSASSIYITGNNWTDAVTAGICTGSGTPSNPYVIDNEIIDANGYGVGILIENSDAYFIIENCQVYNAEGGRTYYSGISLFNVSNGIIRNNNCSFNKGSGISLWGSWNNTIFGNEVNNNGKSGIYIEDTNANKFSKNIANHNNESGMSSSGFSYVNKILRNNMNYNNNSGLSLFTHFNFNTITRNIMNNNTQHGIHITYNCDNNTFSENIIANNSVIGFSIEDTYYDTNSNNLIYHNIFNGTQVHARDDESNNMWNNPTAGNYWDDYLGVDTSPFDYIGDIPYNITGNGGNQDLFPLAVYPDYKNGFIYIDGSGVNPLALGWSETANAFWGTTGSGTWGDPYLIENSTITTNGQFVIIANTTEYFILRNITVRNSNVHYPYCGILITNTDNGRLIDNDCSYNPYDGILLVNSHNNTLSGNTASNSLYTHGIYVENSDNNTITGNTCNNNPLQGIYLTQSTNNTISGNTVYNNNDYGIELYLSSYNTIVANDVTRSLKTGILLNTSSFNIISGNTAYNNSWQGIMSLYSISNKISGNTVYDNDNFGIGLWDSNSSIISGNTIYNNTNYGIFNGESMRNTISGNTIYDNLGDGICLSSSNETIISGNTVHDSPTNGIHLQYSNETTISGNTIYDNNMDGIFLSYSTDTTISGNTVYDHAWKGMRLEYSNNSDLTGNTVYNNIEEGIFLHTTNGNNISGNNINNNDGNGIYINVSSEITIVKNTINSNGINGVGFHICSNTNTIGNILNGNGAAAYDYYLGSNNVFLWNLADGYTDPIFIDDSGSGDFTWTTAINQILWITGSGTSGDPYLIDNIIINGQNSGSCIEIENSNAYLTIQNSEFTNSGSGLTDAGIRLDNADNIELYNDDITFNNGYGIFLYYCQYIDISYCTVNNNSKDGIHLFESDNNDISNNIDTINFNGDHGIFLSASHSNIINSNNIHYNDYAVYLLDSNYNSITNNEWSSNNNTLYESPGCTGNAISGNDIPYVVGGGGGGALDPMIITIIAISAAAIAVIVIVGVIGKKKKKVKTTRPREERMEIVVGERREAISSKERKKKEKQEKKTREVETRRMKLEVDLQKKISFVDYLIKENKIDLAIKSLLEIQKEAEEMKDTSMIKKAEERIFLCKKLQLEMTEKEPKEEVREEVKVEKEIEKVEEKEGPIEEILQKRLTSVDDLIKENKLKLAIQNLVEIQKEAQIHELKDLANSIEEKIISCKKSEVDSINRIKQTILTLGAKFKRLQLADISEKSGIEDEVLIETIILGMIKNKEIQGEYFSRSKALTLETAAPTPVEEVAEGSNVFISYSTLDTDYFQVSKIVRRLELYPEINRVLFWEADAKQNIVEFMEETLRITNAFILFCSENSFKSEAVKGEWQSAYQMVKKGLMKMIPVYENEDHIPRLLWQMLNVKFTKDDFEGFIQKLYEEILR